MNGYSLLSVNFVAPVVMKVAGIFLPVRYLTVAELADLMASEDSGAPALILYGALADGRP